jgi:hypothetical protein
VQRGRLGARIARGDAHHHVLGRCLRVLDGDLPVAVLIEDARVEELELRLGAVPPRVLLDETLVREHRLRVVVAPLHPRVRRRGVEVPPVLLDVLPVIALRVGEAEAALLENRVDAVPEGDGEAEPLLDVTDAGEAVLVPPVGSRARVVMREAVPGIAVGAVVLAHRSP